MARSSQRLACLAVALSLCLHGHRVEELPSGSFLVIEGDEQLSLVHNDCKGVDQTVCKSKKVCIWDEAAEKPLCRPRTCTNLYGSDCKALPSQCVWKWDTATNTGECLDKAAPAAKLKDNPCKDLKGSTCRAKSQDCAWDWDKQTSTGNCRPKNCTGIKGSDCRDLSSQCVWKWDKDTQTGECVDSPKATIKLKDNLCKGLKGSICRGMSKVCAWDWDRHTSTGNCRPKTCAGIKGSHCKELKIQCTWKWDPDTRTGECLDLPKAAPMTSTTTTANVKKLKDNACKDLKGTDCKGKSETCVWDWDKQTKMGNCRPKTCAGIKGSHCKELKSQCTWKWDADTRTGECLDLPKAAPTTSSTTTTTSVKLKDNACKDLKGTDCRGKSEICAWDWDKQNKTGNCRPKTCAGIKGSHCRELTGQCAWKWHQDNSTGECLDLPQASAATVDNRRQPQAASTNITSTTTAASAKLKNNPCKDLNGTDCKGKTEVCVWDWDKKTETGNCRPKTCTGIKGTDCKELTSQCSWKWHQDTKTGECLDLAKAAVITSTTTVSTAPWGISLCTDLKGVDCRIKGKFCVWHWDPQTETGECRPRTCAGLKGDDCKELTSQCIWEVAQDVKDGKCVDIAQAQAPLSICHGLKESKCNEPDCKWRPQSGGCTPRTCVGLKGSLCKSLPDLCIWLGDVKSGECLDVLANSSTFTTTSSTSSHTEWLISLQMVAMVLTAFRIL